MVGAFSLVGGRIARDRNDSRWPRDGRLSSPGRRPRRAGGARLLGYRRLAPARGLRELSSSAWSDRNHSIMLFRIAVRWVDSASPALPPQRLVRYHHLLRIVSAFFF